MWRRVALTQCALRCVPELESIKRNYADEVRKQRGEETDQVRSSPCGRHDDALLCAGMRVLAQDFEGVGADMVLDLGFSFSPLLTILLHRVLSCEIGRA